MQSKVIPNIFLTGIALVGFIGFLDSVYLTAKRFLGGPIPCFVFTGCDTVSQSPYALLFGVPLSVIGILYYLTVIGIVLFYFESGRTELMKLFCALSAIGFVSSAYFIYLQAFVIKAFCFYCVLSAISSTVLFILGIILWRRYLTVRSEVI
jgi:uncharacterized membrane protein